MHKIFGKTSPAGQFLALALIFIILFIITSGLTVVATLFGVSSTSLWLQAVTQVLCFGGTALAFALLFHGNAFSFLKLDFPNKAGIILIGAALVLLCVIPLSDWLTKINDSWHFPESLALLEDKLRELSAISEALMKKFLMRSSTGALVANLFVLAVIPAVCEELLFRGALQQVLQKCSKNVHVAVWLTAAIFSLMHGEIFAFLPRFMLGAVLGYLFYYGGSIWVNATAHFLNNGILVVLYFLVANGKLDSAIVDSFNTPWYIALIGALISIIIIYLIFAKNSTTPSSEEIQ